jgi:hypothetical protein
MICMHIHPMQRLGRALGRPFLRRRMVRQTVDHFAVWDEVRIEVAGHDVYGTVVNIADGELEVTELVTGKRFRVPPTRAIVM